MIRVTGHVSKHDLEVSNMFGWLWRVTKFFIFYIILGPITIPLYIIKWIFKGK